jgi:gas vesicle protein
MRDCNSGSVLGAFFTGALIGGALALLFAPRSGAETRGMIRDFVDEEIDKVKDKAAAARDYVEDEINRYKRQARRTAGRIERTVEHAVEDAREKVEDEIGAIKKAVARRTPHTT